MSAWCLVKNKAEAFVAKIKNGELSYAKLRKMESSERADLFKKTLSVSESDAKRMNVLFEQKLLQKDFMNAMDSWKSKVSGIPTDRMKVIGKQIAKRKEDGLKRVFSPTDNKMFMSELAEHKAGIALTREESSLIFKISQEMRAGSEAYDKSAIKIRLQEAKKGALNENETKIVNTILAKIDESENNGELGKFLKSSAWRDLRMVMEDGIPDDVRENVTGVIERVIASRESDRYGIMRKAYERTIGDLRIKAEGTISGSFDDKEYLDTLKKTAMLVGGTAKAMKGTLDASAIGRQGRQLLFRGIWQKGKSILTGGRKGEVDALLPWVNLVKTNFDAFYRKTSRSKEYLRLAKELSTELGEKKGKETTGFLDGVQIKIYNTRLGRNGVFDEMGIAIGGKEEQFPKSILGKVFGFKHSEEAFTGGLWVARADAATRFYDNMVKTYAKQKIDILAPENKDLYKKELKSIGFRVNSLTGRGTTGIGKAGEVVNVAFWSPKLIQATIDNMTAHIFNKKNFTPNQLKEAADDWIGNIATTGIMLYGANYLLGDDTAETNPTSSKFGTINGFDITGGMGGYIALISRIGVTAFGGGVKSSKTGIIEERKKGEYGQGFVETLAEFASGKTSPLASGLIHYIDGYNFKGESMSWDSENPLRTMWIYTKEGFIPIPAERVIDGVINGESDGFSGAIKAVATLSILNPRMYPESLGFSDKRYVFNPNWEKKDTQEMNAFKEKVGSKKFVEANNDYGRGMNKGIMQFKKSDEYKKLSNANKKKAFENLDNREKSRVFKKYGFNPNIDKPKKDEESDTLSNYEIDGIVNRIQK